MTINRIISFGACILLVTAVGCGPKTVTVSGKVTFDGQPGQNITVLFQGKPVGNVSMEAAMGKTDNQGTYSLSLINSKKRGALPGEYAVFISWTDPTDDSKVDIESPDYKPTPCPYKIPTRATNGEMMFTVPTEGTKEANFEFDSTKESFKPSGV